jgi:hypothetical protein
MTARELLLQLDPWLRGRSACLAAQLPGLGADEVYQQVVEEFLRELDRWLQQGPRVDVVSQARSLMAFCLRHVRTTEIRRRQRLQDVQPGEDDEDPLERVTEPTPPEDGAAARRIVATVRAATSPPCVLSLLSLRLPGLVEQDDAARAKAWTKGGSRAVPRPLPEAWTLYAEGLGRPSLVADDVAWKDHVGIAWYTEGPPGSISAEERRAAAGKVERYANRGADDVRAALLREGDA